MYPLAKKAPTWTNKKPLKLHLSSPSFSCSSRAKKAPKPIFSNSIPAGGGPCTTKVPVERWFSLHTGRKGEHWLLRNWIKRIKDLQQRHWKFSLQIWCKIHRYLHLRRMCNIRRNILRQRRQSGQPMHTSSYRGLMVLSSEFSWRSDFPDHILILQVSTSSTSIV